MRFDCFELLKNMCSNTCKNHVCLKSNIYIHYTQSQKYSLLVYFFTLTRLISFNVSYLGLQEAKVCVTVATSCDVWRGSTTYSPGWYVY
jgi:hypothetical protein